MVFLPLLLTLAVIVVIFAVPVLLVAALLTWKKRGVRRTRIIAGLLLAVLFLEAFLMSTFLRGAF